MGKRNGVDICGDILKVALGGAKKTKIVYQANLNFKIVKGYLRRLIDNGLLQPMEDRYFITTQKGTRFLELYRELIAAMANESVKVVS